MFFRSFLICFLFGARALEGELPFDVTIQVNNDGTFDVPSERRRMRKQFLEGQVPPGSGTLFVITSAGKAGTSVVVADNKDEFKKMTVGAAKEAIARALDVRSGSLKTFRPHVADDRVLDDDSVLLVNVGIEPGHFVQFIPNVIVRVSVIPVPDKKEGVDPIKRLTMMYTEVKQKRQPLQEISVPVPNDRQTFTFFRELEEKALSLAQQKEWVLEGYDNLSLMELFPIEPIQNGFKIYSNADWFEVGIEKLATLRDIEPKWKPGIETVPDIQRLTTEMKNGKTIDKSKYAILFWLRPEDNKFIQK